MTDNLYKYFKATPSGTTEPVYYQTKTGTAADIEKVDPSVLSGIDLASLPQGVGNALPFASLKTSGGGGDSGNSGNPVIDFARYTGTSPYDTAAKNYYEGLDRTAPTAEEESTIREKIRQQMQSQIDAISQSYVSLFENVAVAGEDRLGQTRATQARGGLLGSPMGAAQTEKTRQLNQKEVAALEAEKGLKIQEVFGKIDDRAKEEVKAKKAEALGNTEKYLKYLAATVDKSREDIKTLAQGGVSLDKLSSDQYTKLLDSTGFDKFGLEAFYNANKKEEDKIDYKYEISGNKVFAYGLDPKTGKIVTQQSDLPAGFAPAKSTEYTQVIAPDGTLILTPKTFDTTKPIKDQLLIYGDRKFKAPKDPSDNFFKPSADEKSAAARYLQSLPGFKQSDLNALETDSSFFYTVLQKAIDGDFYKPVTTGY